MNFSWLLQFFGPETNGYNYFTEKEIEDLCKSCGLINYTSKVQRSFIMFSAQKPWHGSWNWTSWRFWSSINIWSSCFKITLMIRAWDWKETNSWRNCFRWFIDRTKSPSENHLQIPFVTIYALFKLVGYDSVICFIFKHHVTGITVEDNEGYLMYFFERRWLSNVLPVYNQLITLRNGNTSLMAFSMAFVLVRCY